MHFIMGVSVMRVWLLMFVDCVLCFLSYCYVPPLNCPSRTNKVI